MDKLERQYAKLYEKDFDVRTNYIREDGVVKNRIPFCNNIFTFDIETSNGFKQPDGRVIAFDYATSKVHPEYYNMASDTVQNKYGRIEPYAIMYNWQFCVESGRTDFKEAKSEVEHQVIMGRTWDELLAFLSVLTKGIEFCSENRREASNYKRINAYVYVHNLGFEFAFIRNIFEVIMSKCGKNLRVFARDRRNPMRFIVPLNGVNLIFMDSLCLVNKSLENWGKDENLEVQKIKEPDDFYMPIRTPNTKLTDEELNYASNDVETMYYGIRRFRGRFIYMHNIPITQTGIIRRRIRAEVSCVNKDWVRTCQEIERNMTVDLLKKLYDCFAGGWVHSNKSKTNYVFGINNYNVPVTCVDIRSSYPAVMTMFTVPTGSFVRCSMDDIRTIMQQNPVNRNRRFFIKFKAYNVKAATDNTFWSNSHIEDSSRHKDDDGNLVSADYIVTTMTDLDFEIFCKAYRYSNIEFIEGYTAEASYFPKELIKFILKQYKNKTSLKGLKDKKSKYSEAKIIIDSIYGDFVLKRVADKPVFVGDFNDKKLLELRKNGYIPMDVDITTINDNIKNGWLKIPFTDGSFQKLQQELLSDNTLYKNFQCGCWVSAAARYNLWSVILKLDKNVIYGDTDSIKGQFNSEQLEVINEYNNEVRNRYKAVVEYFNDDEITIDDFEPKTQAGTVKELGFFDFEEPCVYFKTLGSKCYFSITKTSRGYEAHATVSGISKLNVEKKVLSLSNVPHHLDDDTVVIDSTNKGDLLQIMKMFKNDIMLECDESGKNIAYYLDDMQPAKWIDRDGNEYVSTDKDKFGICIKPTEAHIGVNYTSGVFSTNASGELDINRWGRKSSLLEN